MTGAAFVVPIAGAVPRMLFHVAPPAFAAFGAGHFERSRSILCDLAALDAPQARTQDGLNFLILLRRRLKDREANGGFLRIRRRSGRPAQRQANVRRGIATP